MAQQSAGDLECQLAQAQRELAEALERQAATDEVLLPPRHTPPANPEKKMPAEAGTEGYVPKRGFPKDWGKGAACVA